LAPAVAHARQVRPGSARRRARIVFARAAEFRRQARERFGVAAFFDPARAQRREARGEVDVRAGSVYGPEVS
jgi:hypothetical protein